MLPCNSDKTSSKIVQRTNIPTKKDQTKSRRHLAQENMLAELTAGTSNHLIRDKENLKPSSKLKQTTQGVKI